MFDLLPFSRRRSTLPSLFSDMDDRIKRLWVDFPFHDLSSEDMDVTWSPRLDVSESQDNLEIVADLPGLKKEDISVSLDDNLLTIKGERAEEKEDKGRHYHTIERRSGSFYRALRLPVEVKQDKVEANFKDGVLTLRLPKNKDVAQKVTQIDIK